MANPRRNRNVQTPVTLADLLSRFKGTPADSPREKVRQRAKLADIQTRMNLPETLPNQTTNLLQTQQTRPGLGGILSGATGLLGAGFSGGFFNPLGQRLFGG